MKWLKRISCQWLIERDSVERLVLKVHGAKLELSVESFGYIMGVMDRGRIVEVDGDFEEL